MSSLQKWIISHPRVFHFLIKNEYITVKFYDGNRGLKNELRKKVLFQVSVRELHIYLKKRFYWVLHGVL